MQFQEKIKEFENKGVTIIGISYDDATVLKNFSDKYTITYPLLSDTGSRVIKMFGILKQDSTASSKSSGLPNPGLYIIDKNLTVLDKHFEKSYAARPSAQTVLITSFGDSARAGVQHFSTPYLNGQIALSDATAYPAQVVTMSLRIKMRDGFHLYGQPIPNGYVPFTVTATENPNFTIDEFQLPPGKPFKIDGLDENFFILPDSFDITTSLRTGKRPELGGHTIKLTLKLQACSDKVCLPPEKILVEAPIAFKQEL